MAYPPKKGSLAILVAPKASMGGKAPPPEEEEDPSDMEMAAQELINAVKKGDASAVADALRAAYSSCQMETE